MLYRTYPGTAGARASADIVARVNGTLLTRDYTSGSLVDKGTVLFTIEPTQYNDAVMQSRASLETARSEYTYASNQAAAEKSPRKRRRQQTRRNPGRKQYGTVGGSNKGGGGTAQSGTHQPWLLHDTSTFQRAHHLVDRRPRRLHIRSGSPFTLATIYDDAEVVVTFSISEPQYQQMLGIRGTPQEEIFRKVPLSFDNELAHKYTGDLYYTSPIIDKKYRYNHPEMYRRQPLRRTSRRNVCDSPHAIRRLVPCPAGQKTVR